MRPIDADALFDSAFKVWGTEADVGETNLFMEMINNAPTIAPPPNDPLNLDELREMDGDYVYAVLPSGLGNRWAFVQVLSGGRSGTHLLYHDGASSAGFLLDCGAKFYRRKPEEGSL